MNPLSQSPRPGDYNYNGYNMTERPNRYGGLLNPSSDRLAAQPTFSVENLPQSHGHAAAYDAARAGYRTPSPIRSPDYALDPEAHHDAYYTEPYHPSPSEYTLPHYGNDYVPEYGVGEYADDVPILSAPEGISPDGSRRYAPSPVPSAPRLVPSPAPVRRWKTIKEVPLFDGNLVLDCPVPPRLLSQINHAPPPGRDEFTHMRYSAATCDPVDFYRERFTLRQRLFARPRETELFIVVTMYNEDDFLFARTMAGVFKNIEVMCNKKRSKTWGADAWKKIVVCVVSDGRAKINPRTRAVLAALGVYQDGIAKQQVNGKDVTAHIYEYTTQMSLKLDHGVVRVFPRRDVPVQMVFCLKEKNQKKINSHRWFFQAFGPVLQPNVCVLVDAGTKPGHDSIYQLWRAFDVEPNCGGACGEIKVMLDKGKALINPVVAGQNFEYKMSNILDKPLESAFGFISVLPGAFSAYRYVALQNDPKGDGPLERYFAGEKMHGANAGIFTANMYLAEDRILCHELVSKRNSNWLLRYVKSATGETDVPDKVAEFILQRRRWLNGSFFAGIYGSVHFYQIGRSSHSFLRKIMLLILNLYQTINTLFAWFQIGNFFLVFRILTTSLGSDELLGTAGKILGVVFEWLYLVALLSCFILALGNRPGGSAKLYLTMVIFWACLMGYLIFATVFVTVKSIQSEIQHQKHFSIEVLFKNREFITMIVSLASTYLLWIIASILFLDPWHMITCFIQYMLLTPTYTNILNVYAFCNTHDITWGTKGDETPAKLPSANVRPDGKVDVALPQDDNDLDAQYAAELRAFSTPAPPVVEKRSEAQSQEDYYKGFRSTVVLVWIVCNFTLGAVVLNSAGFDRIEVDKNKKNQDSTNKKASIYMAVILWSVAGLSFFRFLGMVWFLFVRMFRGV